MAQGMKPSNWVHAAAIASSVALVALKGVLAAVVFPWAIAALAVAALVGRGLEKRGK